MSLQVWLPLNGSLKNQGLSDQTVNITTSPVWSSIGKIGANALYTKTRMTTMNFPGLIGKSVYSVAYWLHIPTAISPTAWSDMFGIQFNCGGTNMWERDERRAATTTGRHNYHLAKSTSEGANTNGYYGTIEDDSANDNWIHVTMVKDNTNARLFFNTELKTTISNSNFENSPRTMTGAVYLGDSGCETYLQDFRIYDHALSIKEIEELSMGLVLHYKLDNGGGKVNNIKRSAIVNRSCTSFTYDKATAEWTAVCPVNSSTWGVGFYIGDSSIKWAYGETWVVSLEVYVPQSITWNCDINNKPDLADISSYTGNDYDITSQRKVNTNGVNNSKTLQAGWNKIWFSQTASGSTYGLSNYSTNWGIVTSSLSDSITIKLRNIKGEIVSSNEVIQPTSFIANNNDLSLDSNIIYDSSGYENNGEIINGVTILSDTPRYEACTHMSATNQKIKISNFPTSGFGNSYSFAWWEKISSVTPMHWGFADGIRLNGMYTGRLWNTGDSSNNPLYNPGTTTQVTAPTVNVWHHWVMTGDGTTCKVYQDGVLWATAKTYKAISGSTIYINGWDSGTSYCSDNASISDFRIYATALTEEQVKELYNTSATIDKSGNVYAREVVEISE